MGKRILTRASVCEYELHLGATPATTSIFDKGSDA